MFLITPADVEKEAVFHGLAADDLAVPSLVFFTFNRAILDELNKICALREWEWQGGEFSPYYGSYTSWRGLIDGREVSVFYPPMGASAIAAFSEDLIHYGARTIFLLCASWSLGRDYLEKGQIHLPSFALGPDGTSVHYGNNGYKIEAEPRAFKALTTALDNLGAKWRQGGVGTCEAFYRISTDLMQHFRDRSCLSLENGEVSVLYSLAREHNIPIGVLLQPYIDLEQGWKMSFMDETYKETCRLQARAAIEAARILNGQCACGWQTITTLNTLCI